MPVHPNDATHWPEIACNVTSQPHSHLTRKAHVKLGGPTAYHDYPGIPERFAREFSMDVWDWKRAAHPSAGGYCPARDIVSETIVTHGVWEVAETIVMLDAFDRRPDNIFVDMGAQIGWYSILAATSGLDVVTYEADDEVADVLEGNLDRLDVDHWSHRERISSQSGLLAPATKHLTVKIDVEGAEPEAVAILELALGAGQVDFLLIEVSPVFHGGYPWLVRHLMEGAGLVAMVMPDKSTPPPVLDSIDDLVKITDAEAFAAEVAGFHQANVLFARPEML